ncbi:ABC transporter permease [Microbacterium sp. SSM24]|uniref:ABC transporter permease n=1 Tax=Microbacterium sp. SSM24 TaxID=2991714 RepID=UPI002226ED26|nr:ABC transporter permease subunit [Microbacterium sp. SSM24]MCW3492666.1 ABC transporter permease subunit [Microbacterium sp. SSM24]
MNWISQNLAQIGTLLAAHLAISIPAILLTVLIAVPLGRFAQASGRGRGALLAVTGILYAIPSLPLLIVIPIITGLPLRSAATMILALTVYGVALLARTTADAFAAVPAESLEAATATGHNPTARFLRVELPLAAPVLVAGTRVVAMSTIGLATIGALIGIPSLGTLFTDGFQRGIAAEVATGIVLTLVVALVVDAILLGIGRATQPWTRTLRREGAFA